jgi:hypothetical protein
VAVILLAVITFLFYRYKDTRSIANDKLRKKSNDHGEDTTENVETSDVDDTTDTENRKEEETTATIPYAAKVRM